ncbi:TPA: thermonuclease family protein [Escherichia coli]|nr:thermonuclease family protein [Escherichia coli]HCL6287060.1 thermonuclease family protein [Escherichia coli]
MKKSVTLILFLAVTFPSLASTAKVTRILDGDTIEVKMPSEDTPVTEISVRVRLTGIDAPEKQQPYGQRSKQHLADMIGGKWVTMAIDGHDRYNRILGDVFIKQCATKCEAVSVNAAMVKAGMAWAYRYHNVAVNPHMAALEVTARSEGLGLWRDKKPVEPWKWRQEHK